jgi:flavodoxin
MKTLIVYYSYTQNNEQLAKKLHRKLGCDILKIEELKRRTRFSIFIDLIFNRKAAIKTNPCSLRDYDQVICVAPIWAARIPSPLKTFLLAEKNNIKRYSFLTLCGGVIGQKEKIEKQLTATLGKKPSSLAELWLNDILTKEKKATIKNTIEYRVDQKDLALFEPTINDFLSKDGMPLSKGWEVEHEYGD